jgi:thymidylate synthase (FAD)
MSQVKLVWTTPGGDWNIAYMARVSNPDNQDNPEYTKLIGYLMKHKHWSPFEMVNACMEITTTRDIARQILRHRSFSFQEFSQRYAVADGYEYADVRLQDKKNRQNSIEIDDRELLRYWHELQIDVLVQARRSYEKAMEAGIAKELARKVLPEGLTTSKMYMNGTLRSWLHYISVRTDPSTQKEHRIVAEQCKELLAKEFPKVMEAYELYKE